jgi:hypothetical protein
MPDPQDSTKKKTYPIKDATKRRDNLYEGSGKLKEVSDMSGQIYYTHDASGKLVETKSTRHAPTPIKPGTPHPKKKSEGHSVGSFDHSKDRYGAQYLEDMFNHTKGAQDKKKGKTSPATFK